jgi:hypothetical protein
MEAAITCTVIPKKIERESAEQSDDSSWNPFQKHPKNSQTLKHRLDQD